VGDALSIADISLASSLVSAPLFAFPPNPQRFPKLSRFVERMRSRASFAGCIVGEMAAHGRRWR
jgi:glutathione S-transferase